MRRNRAVKNMFREQLKWASWLLLILLFLRAGHYLLYFLFPEAELMLIPFIEASHQPAKIYMLLTGILTVFIFLELFVRHGQTRKLFVTGSAAVSFVVSALLAAAVYIMTGIGYFLLSIFDLQTVAAASFPFDGESARVTGFFVFTLTIWFYYIIGLLIAGAFYRFGGVIGAVFVIFAVVLLFAENYLWASETFLTGFQPLNIPAGILLLLITGAAFIMLIATFFILKDIRIKTK
ncbi:MAG: hypothetical protein EA344_08775 [Alkalicoccus sp.]|nr:MAG: hypothetical protein EA344_08775 [Alkalicoccus sp.]